MTLEEIKKRIKALMYEAQVGMCCHDYNESDFQKGKRHAYMDCLKVLDTLEPSWHSYPAEIPDKDGTYLITSENGSVYVFPFWVSNGKFSKDRRSSKVVAWMEMPKPYKKEDE